MSLEDPLTMRLTITLVAGSVVVFVAFALIRSIFRRGMHAVREILSATAGLVCMVLIGLSSRGKIGSWGVWLGIGAAAAIALTVLFVHRNGQKRGNRPIS
jgi:O-antigen/teichoic acid export membrane protein